MAGPQNGKTGREGDFREDEVMVLMGVIFIHQNHQNIDLLQRSSFMAHSLLQERSALGEVLQCIPWTLDTAQKAAAEGVHTYRLEVMGEALSQRLEAIMPLLGRLLQEKSDTERERKLDHLIDFMTEQMVVPSAVDIRMAQRLATRHAAILQEFGYLSDVQLAELNHSRAASRTALADNWKRRRIAFAVRHRDAQGREQDVFLRFQFDELGRPLKIIQTILTTFGPHKAPWKLAMWFTSANGWLQGQARPVDLLLSHPEAVLEAARHDAEGSAA